MRCCLSRWSASPEFEFLDQLSLTLLVFRFRIGLIEVSGALIPPYRRLAVVLETYIGNAVRGRDSLEDEVIEF